jgi:hypothetical protein
MKRFWPRILMGVGLLVLVGGFAYDTMFAGLPYQDPTPQMSARYAHHSRIAGVICWTGVAVFLLGGLGSIIRRVARRFQPRVDL